jgi:type I restriction enzyme R subunit
MQKALDEIKILKGEAERTFLYSHRKFVEPMLQYIVEDFQKARIAMNDKTIGGMVICDSSDQAKMLYEVFQEQYEVPEQAEQLMAAETAIFTTSGDRYKVKSAALILHDIGDKQFKKDQIEDFKEGKIDLLFVFNMLLTGFDAPRLKKLYIGRVIKAHNLLQALTRVNRTYKDYRYGYVVDFADIQKQFDIANRDYFNELQDELGDEIENYSNLFKTADEIEAEIDEIKEVLFHFDTVNAEEFSKQISQIQDRSEMLKIVKALNNAKELYNLIRLSGNFELLEKLDFQKLTILSREAQNHLTLINQKEALESSADTQNLLNIALEDIIFTFTKVGEEELIIADQLKDTLQKTREALGGNFDQRDPEFISLKEELERLFKKKNLTEVSKEDMESNIAELETIFRKARKLERKNQLLKAKYHNDEKYARLHKRLMEKDPLTDKESKLFEALSGLKDAIDLEIMQKSDVLNNESFVEKNGIAPGN